MASYRTILVGTDGSDSSFRAVDGPAQLAAATGATLVLACAYSPMPDRERAARRRPARRPGLQGPGLDPRRRRPARRPRARRRAPAPRMSRRSPSRATPVDALAQAGRATARSTWSSSATAGLNSLAGRLLGSVPANLSHRARCDMLIVHTDRRQIAVRRSRMVSAERLTGHRLEMPCNGRTDEEAARGRARRCARARRPGGDRRLRGVERRRRGGERRDPASGGELEAPPRWPRSTPMTTTTSR